MNDDRHGKDVADLLRAVLGPAAVTDVATRETAFRGGRLPPALDEFAAKVRDHSERVTDGDIARLRANGYSEDDIFEVAVAAALGAAARRLDAGLRAMERGT